LGIPKFTLMAVTTTTSKKTGQFGGRNQGDIPASREDNDIPIVCDFIPYLGKRTFTFV